tara:strand:- start:834 stop:1805 length:972 start_codon:yes stop_codon:yes gene_type:complete
MFTRELKKTSKLQRRKTKSLSKLDTYLESFKAEGTTKWEVNYGGNLTIQRLVTFTPELAAKILSDFNNNNRPLNKGNLKFLSKELLSGNWIPNGDSITFDTNGDCNNGQHRLKVIVDTNTTLDILTITNLSKEAFKTIDTGKTRSGSDVLSIEGIANSSHHSSVVKFIYAFKQNRYSANRQVQRTLSHTNLVSYFYELGEDKLYEAFQFYNSVRDTYSSILTPTYVSGFYYLLTEIDAVRGEEFLRMLCEGLNLTKNSPITALRSKLIKAKFDKNYKLTNEDLLKNISYAWEKYLQGKQSKMLKVPSDYEIKLAIPKRLNLDF